ncbi:MAG TPA: sulfite exporter TauE/SafE family protein [Actinomycetota bacterium]|jgi:nickel/cobalt exporter|nr:sulfite exporter TauE/SafE family protein [Actinomycetota bacterium]
MAFGRRWSASQRATRAVTRLALVVGVSSAVLLTGTGAAQAHPLGNFTVNLYDGLTVRTGGIDVDYVVDMAEIPAFEEKQSIDANGDGTLDQPETVAYVDNTCERLADGVTVAVADAPVPIRPAGTGTITFPPGAGGLSTLRLECPMHGRVTVHEGQPVTYRDGNFPGRIGWHEITVVGDRLAVLDSDAPAASASTRLTSYPANLLQSPLDQRTASFRVGGATDVAAAPVTDTIAPITRDFGDRLTGAFAGLVTTGGSTPLLWVLALATAFAIGGIHALGPGHGKTLMAAYLVGSDARPRQVVAVGAAVSVMHTASVVVLGLAVLLAGQAFTPEVAYRWTTIASGAVVAGLGLYLAVTRVRNARRARTHDLAHAHGHDHEHGHTHDRPAGRFGLATLAVSGGILPSPSALIALLAAVAIGRVVFGLALVLAFGLGLATILVAVGFGTIKARSTMDRRLSRRVATWAPIVSAVGICLLGTVLVARTL